MKVRESYNTMCLLHSLRWRQRRRKNLWTWSSGMPAMESWYDIICSIAFNSLNNPTSSLFDHCNLQHSKNSQHCHGAYCCNVQSLTSTWHCHVPYHHNVQFSTNSWHHHCSSSQTMLPPQHLYGTNHFHVYPDPDAITPILQSPTNFQHHHTPTSWTALPLQHLYGINHICVYPDPNVTTPSLDAIQRIKKGHDGGASRRTHLIRMSMEVSLFIHYLKSDVDSLSGRIHKTSPSSCSCGCRSRVRVTRQPTHVINGQGHWENCESSSLQCPWE